MKKVIGVVALPLFALFSSLCVFADNRPDSHAPISVMGDHKHHKGEFMFSYRYMHMNMGENMDGSNDVSPEEILDPASYNYLVSPLEMEMDMHMLGLMYAPTHRLTLMAMVNVIDLTMDHRTRMGTEFTTEADGLGDTKLSGIYELTSNGGSAWFANLGLSIPTGSIDEEDIIPAVSATEDSQLPFPMQLGSGTYDLSPGLTYTQMNADNSWGAQVMVTIRLGENDNGYTLGDRFQAQAWHAWLVSENVSLSTRIAYADWADYDGLDEEQALPVFNPMMNANTVATVNPELRGGSQADFAVGVNSIWGGAHRVSAEVTYPAWHDLDGPQLATDLTYTLGYQLAF